MPGAATRVTAGACRGRLLKTPPGRATRPTTSLVREALFNIIGDSIRGARVLDLFAGAGTLGIEALSRGAASATFVERDRACANIVAENLAATGFAPQGDVASADAIDWLRAHAGDLATYNLLLLDPPYRDSGAVNGTLQALDQASLRQQALVVVEHHRSQPLPSLHHLAYVRHRDYGTTRLTFFRSPVITAVYPGSFDPLTHGHLDIVDRAARIFDRVVIAVLENPSKRPLFTTADRVRMIRESLGERPSVEVSTFNGLTIDFARQVGAKVIVRGLRAVSDFESEFQMALMNRRLEPEVTTVFIPTSLRHLFLSSSLIKELAEFGGDISEFVPANVVAPLKQRLTSREQQHEHP